jgi:hypothetical protein
VQKWKSNINSLEKYLPTAITTLVVLCVVCLGIIKSFEGIAINSTAVTKKAALETDQSLSIASNELSPKEELAEMLRQKGDTKGSYKLMREEWERTGNLASLDPRYQNQFVQAQLKMIDLIFDQSSYLDAIKYTQRMLESEQKQKNNEPNSIARDTNNLGVSLQFEASTIPLKFASRRAEYLNLAVQYYENAATRYAQIGKHRSSEVIAKLNEYQALKDLGKEEDARKILQEARTLNVNVGFNLSPPMYFD